MSRTSALSRAAAAVVLAGALALSGCAGSGEAPEASSTPIAGGTLSFGTDNLPLGTALEPINPYAPLANRNVLSQIYETLLRTNDDGELEPGIATAWSQVDATTYEFTLRPGETFSDGTPLTPDDVIFSLDAYAKPLASAGLADYTGATATADGKVRVTFSEPNGAFLPTVANYSGLYIVSKAWYESTSAADRARTALGTGPFALKEWQDGVSLTLTRNTYYWDEGKPYLDEIDFIYSGDDTARLAMLQQGQIDMAVIGNTLVAKQADAAGLTPGASPELSTTTLHVNAGDGPLSDLKVRQAVSLALNRDELIAVGLNGGGELSYAVPAGLPGAPQPDADTPFYTQNVEEAKKLIAESAFPHPEFDLTYGATSIGVSMMEVIKEQLAAVGITVNLKSVEWPAIAAILGGAPAPQGLFLLPSISLPDVANYFGMLEQGPLDFWQGNPVADEARDLRSQLVHETDPAERATLLKQLSDNVAENVLVLIPAVTPVTYEFLSDKVKGYVPDAFLARYSLTETWVQP